MKLIYFILLLFPLTSVAMFCPNNMNSIEMGFSPDEIQQQCGAPTSIKTYQAPQKQAPQLWQYYKVLNPSSQNKLSVTIKFADEKAVNINVDGFGLVTTAVCGANIKVNDSMSAVKAACGKPDFITKNETNNNAKPADIIEYLYDGTPPTKFIFENNQLKQRQ